LLIEVIYIYRSGPVFRDTVMAACVVLTCCYRDKYLYGIYYKTL